MTAPRRSATHEDFYREHEVRTSSDRTFGLVVAAFFAALALVPMLLYRAPRIWALPIAAAFLLVAIIRPVLLAPLNKLWGQLGLLLNRITNPVIMVILFYGAVTPIAFLMRIAGKDQLGLEWKPEARSYWVPRTPPGQPPESMRDQF
jgi:hypothetical protein